MLVYNMEAMPLSVFCWQLHVTRNNVVVLVLGCTEHRGLAHGLERPIDLMYVGLTLVGVIPSNANSIAAGTPVTSKASIVSIVRVRRTRTCRTGYAHPRTWYLASPQCGCGVRQ